MGGKTTIDAKKSPVKRDTTDVEGPVRGGPPTVVEEGSEFFSFRYSYKEVSLSGGRARIRSREHRFEDGKFQSEEFDGTMDESVYHSAVEQTRDLLVNQTGGFLKLFSAFLPFSPRSRDK